ncbi:hypothetical protein [Actinobaculum massiliense]|nr:hypothetical protein [Actinobaculum massiliense]
MRINPRLGVFWRDGRNLQIGLDPRCGVILGNITSEEQDFVSMLTRQRSAPEVLRAAADHGISEDRARELVSLLERAGVMTRPHDSRENTFQRPLVPALDPLGVEVVFALARAGISTVITQDSESISPADHPALRSFATTGKRLDATLAALGRQGLNLKLIQTGSGEDTEADCAFITGAGTIDPLRCDFLMARSLPHLLVCSEDRDISVGPLVLPHRSACARCLYHHRLSADPYWALVAPQVYTKTPAFAPLADLALGALHAVRAIDLSFTNRQLRIPPTPGIPELVDIAPHPECGCMAQVP